MEKFEKQPQLDPLHEFLSQIILNELVAKLDALKKSGEVGCQKYLDLADAATNLNINFTRAITANKKVVESRPVETQRDVIRYVWDLESMNFN